MTEKTFPRDTQWAVAASVPAKALAKVRRELPRWLRGTGTKIATGKDGFAALLVFGGATDLGEALAIELSTEYETPVYLLDFDDEAPSIVRFVGTQEKEERGYPADFLEQRGIVAPGYEPSEPSRTITVGVVDGVTIAEARRALPKGDFEIVANGRGVVIDFGMAAIEVGISLGRTSYTLSYDPDGTFTCAVFEPGKPGASFGEPNANWTPLDSILGETTLDGILRVLEIPRRMIFDAKPSWA